MCVRYSYHMLLCLASLFDLQRTILLLRLLKYDRQIKHKSKMKIGEKRMTVKESTQLINALLLK